MVDSNVARRYAKSIFDLATERNIIDKVNADMMLVSSTIEGSRELVLLLRHPLVQINTKDTILKEIFGKHVDQITLKFFEIITRKGREEYIPEIAREFVQLYKDSKGLLTAHVTTAVALDATTREQVLTVLRKAGHNNIELVEKVDASLIGGFVLRVGDNQIDSSVSNSLLRLKNEFEGNPYKSAI
jgi:F-type H+-transporting ATPase subunit delta